ncbi:hypothetical protein GGR52DRAFT_153880 [Hypoxylon sp. FL1284]|nr:hypothetical protein GGR52DRAFT_153880 [Hypoxylon sp. FL1284]
MIWSGKSLLHVPCLIYIPPCGLPAQETRYYDTILRYYDMETSARPDWPAWAVSGPGCELWASGLWSSWALASVLWSLGVRSFGLIQYKRPLPTPAPFPIAVPSRFQLALPHCPASLCVTSPLPLTFAAS